MRKFYYLFFTAIVLCISLIGYSQNNPYKAPLYWSVYEHHIVKEQNGVTDNYIPEDVWLANIDWVDENLKDLGYKMVCLDGWGDVSIVNENGYRASHSRHWQHDLAWWSQHLQDRGMQLGIYGNPLWVHVADDDMTTKIVGTDIPVSSLKNPEENARFPWVQVDRPGAEQYVKGYIKYYADMGIKYFRVDFLSWYENGQDRYLGTVGPDRPHDHYVTALRWMREACDEYGVFLSLVMPHLFNEAEVELQYGHMFRINEDTGHGQWFKWNENARGVKRVGWSVYANAVDGLTYWSYVSGRNKMILDPDFLRINTFSGNDEKKSVISLCLLSGAPVTVSDQYNTIGPDVWVYQNKELLELNSDGFAGKPLTNDPTDPASQIWTGQMSNGDWIIGLFNRENDAQSRSISFSELGISGNAFVRDLWQHKNLGSMTSYSATVPAHGVVVLKISTNELTGVESMHVASFSTNTSNGKGTALVVVKNDNGVPVANAEVEVQFSASFDEKVSGITDGNGSVTIATTSVVAGAIKVNACVVAVKHPEHVYAADKNVISCIADYRYVAGSFNNWNLARMNWRDSVWMLNDISLQSGSYELKFANTSDWSGDDWGNASGLEGRARLSTGGKPNLQFTISTSGMYNITFNENTLWYTIRRAHQKVMFIGGTFNNWTLSSTPMVLEGDTWQAKDVQIGEGNHELKFANTDNWAGDDWGNAVGLTGRASLSTGGAPNLSFTLEKSSKYTISFNDLTFDYAIIDQDTVTGSDDELDEDEYFIAYPNPADDILNFKSRGKGKISLINSFGVTIEKFQIKDGQFVIDISNYLPGLYNIRFTKGNETYYQKVIIR